MKLELLGQTFGKWSVIERLGPIMPHTRRVYWLCRCTCGTERPVWGIDLRRGGSLSCGCETNVRHGHTRGGKIRPEHNIWNGMLGRCHNPNDRGYHRYGGRGIYVCDRWRFGENDKSAYECFVEDMGDRPTKHHSIDRINNDGPYAPWNCRWATYVEQGRNQSTNRRVTYHGRNINLSEALELSGLPRNTYYARLERGMTPTEALEMPRRKNSKWA